MLLDLCQNVLYVKESTLRKIRAQENLLVEISYSKVDAENVIKSIWKNTAEKFITQRIKLN